jgi:amidohydrolase
MELDSAVTGHRRWLHGHAEPPFEERETTAYIVKALEDMGIETISFPDHYGAIGVVQGGKPGGTVMLRAGIDALPMQERSGESFAATNGCMHACGNDCHAAMLLGAARMLSERKDELRGTVKLLFQSAGEEVAGARYYADKGHIDGVDALFGLHVRSTMQAPHINIQDGPRLASCDSFTITIRGRGAHGSSPHLARDPIMAASAIIMNLQTFVSRNRDPLCPLIITVGTVKSGSQFNIIPETAILQGTARTLSRELRPTVEPGMRRIVEGTAAALGCAAELSMEELVSPVVNSDIRLNGIASAAAAALFGRDILAPMAASMEADDFSRLLERAPGLYVFLGCLNTSRGIVHPERSGGFRVDEDILHRGAALYARFARDFLADGADA